MAQKKQLTPDPGGQFDSDVHRRVVGNLSIPLNFSQLAKALAEDPNVPELEERELAKIVGELQDDGHLKALGTHDDADELIKAIRSDDAVPSLQKDKAEHFVLRTKRRGIMGRTPHTVSGEQLYFTKDGLDALQAGVPNEPPELEGPALEAAHAQDKALLAEVEAKVAEDVGRLKREHQDGAKTVGSDDA